MVPTETLNQKVFWLIQKKGCTDKKVESKRVTTGIEPTES